MLSRGRRGVMLVDVLLDTLIEDPVSLENEIDGITPGPLPTCIGSDVMGRRLNLVAGVGDCDGQSARAHDRQVDHVVAHVGDLVKGKGSTLHDLAYGTDLEVLAHVDVFHAQCTGALGHCFRCALGDDASMDATEAGKRDANPVVGMESLGLKRLVTLAGDGRGERPYLAISEDSVYIEEYEADAAGAFSGRKSIASF